MRTSDDERICLSTANSSEDYEVAVAPTLLNLWLPCK